MRLQECAIVLAAMLLAAGAAQAVVTIDMVTVGDPGNPFTTEPEISWLMPGTRDVGDVAYVYNIGKTEVKASQYTEFLNAVAATDTHDLYDGGMDNPVGTDMGCQIIQSGASGSFTYVANSPDLPVNWVGLGDAIRFVNWLHNGQPTGAQDLTTTEDGTYFLNGATEAAGMQAALVAGRDAGAFFFLPTESEWVKAARYDPGYALYNDYATGWNVLPTSEAPPGGTNSANYDKPLGSPNGDLFDVGAYVASVSPYGTFDQNGSVTEMCESMYAKAFGGSGTILLGGDLANASLATVVFSNPQNETHRYGFRVAAPGPEVVITGDFDGDGDIDGDDVDILCANMGGDPATYDVDDDGDVDEDDMIYHIENLVELTDGVRVGTKRGDFNLDGFVDGTDLALMKVAFGQPDQNYADGNANCDVLVDGTDLAILKVNMGFIAPTGGAVPEPVTIGLFIASGAWLLRRRRAK